MVDEVGTIDVKRFEFEWKIVNDFKFLDLILAQKKKVYTPDFMSNYDGDQWFLELYLSETDDTFLSIYVEFRNNAIIDRELIIISISLLDRNGALIRTCELDPDEDYVDEFAKKDFFMNAENNVFSIVCKLHPIENDTIVNIKTIERADILDDYETLLFDKKSSDFTVISADKKIIHVHKAILACRSPVFKAMFGHDMLEKNQNIVNIEDVKHEALIELLRFIYSGKVNRIEQIFCELLYAADKYCIESLKLMCEESIVNNLTVTNAMEYLVLSDKNNASVAKKKILIFIRKNLQSIIKTPEFESLGASHVNLFREIIKTIASNK